MNQIGLLALAVLTVASVALWVAGQRFTRRYVTLHRARPPLTWMFRKTDDPELERSRLAALVILPIDLIALAAYLFRP